MTPEVLEAIVHEGGPGALATVVSALDSAPRDPGACMAILGSGKVVGSSLAAVSRAQWSRRLWASYATAGLGS